jgi:hypothetical protein
MPRENKRPGGPAENVRRAVSGALVLKAASACRGCHIAAVLRFAQDVFPHRNCLGAVRKVDERQNARKKFSNPAGAPWRNRLRMSRKPGAEGGLERTKWAREQKAVASTILDLFLGQPQEPFSQMRDHIRRRRSGESNPLQ